MALTPDEVLEQFRKAGALLEGHFILTSGLHSPVYLQCARVLMEPQRAELLCRELAERVVEDVVTTGKSSRECIACIEQHGGRVVLAASLIDRSGGNVDLGVPLVALATIEAPAYPADALPPELAKLPPTKPGSRHLV